MESLPGFHRDFYYAGPAGKGAHAPRPWYNNL